MIRSRNQNSILAVATLGVYLGLILAGATPSVLAQAATAKQFDVNDEMARRDDLDSDPNMPKSKAALEGFLSDTEAFLLGFRDVVPATEVVNGDNLLREVVIHGCGTRKYVWGANPDDYQGRPEAKGLFADYAAKLFGGYGLSRCVPAPQDGEGAGRRAVKTRIGVGSGMFFVELYFIQPTPAEAQSFRDLLRRAIYVQETSINSAIRAQLLTRATIAADNDQIVLMTSLPRGSLDTLLASNAK